MKYLTILLLFTITLFLSNSCTTAGAENEKSKVEVEYATCVGGKPCKPCSTCNYCKHCSSDGGTCGVCATTSLGLKAKVKPTTKNNANRSNSSVSSQCKGTTKKGARCKRTVRGGGYCWQHG